MRYSQWTGLTLLILTLLLNPTVHSAPTPGASAADNTAPAPPPSAAPTPIVGWLEISGALREGPLPFDLGGDSQKKPSMARVASQLRHVAQDKNIRGLVIFLDEPELSFHQIFALAQAIRHIRAQGKKVLVFAEAYDLRSYLLACSADEILLQHKGQIELTGLGVEEMYLAGLLEKIGVRMDLLQVGKFKGADETFTRSGPSPEWNLNMDGLLDDLYHQVIDTLARARGLEKQQVVAAMGDSLNLDDGDYVRRGLVDRLVDRHMTQATEAAFGDHFEWDEDLGQTSTLLPMDNPFAIFRLLFQPPRKTVTRPGIAIVHAQGAITSGPSQRGSQSLERMGFFSSESIGSRTMAKTLQEVRDDENIQAVVLRLDSPGGSALASEVIWQALRDLAEEKPVFAVIGDMAASGGYYLASACDQVYVSPASIVGSIGVVGGKMVLGSLYEKLGISVHRRSRGPLGDLFNSVEPFSARQRAAVESSMKRTYDLFLDRVKTGRGQRIKDVDAVAQGRIFTGRQAVELGMADKIGSLQDALHDLAAQVNLKEGDYDLIHLPEPMTLPEFLESIFGFSTMSAVWSARDSDFAALLKLAQPLLGDQLTRQVGAVLCGLMLLRNEPVLALEPRVIHLR